MGPNGASNNTSWAQNRVEAFESDFDPLIASLLNILKGLPLLLAIHHDVRNR